MRSRFEHRHAGVAMVAVSIVTLSIGSTIVRKTGSPGSVVAFWRLSAAAVVWHVVLRVRGTRLTKAQWRAVLPCGVLFGVNLVCFFTAVQHTRIANAEFTGTLAPAIVVPLAAWRLKEKVSLRTILLGLVALCGVALIILTAAKGGSSLFGDLLAAFAVCTWSTYLLVTKRVRRDIDTKAFMAVMSTVAAVVVAPVAFSTHKVTTVSGRGWLLIGVMVLTSGILAHGALAWAQRRVPVSTISIMQLCQPGISTVWALLLLGESVRAIQVVGMAVVLVAVGFIALQSTRTPEALAVVPDTAGVVD